MYRQIIVPTEKSHTVELPPSFYGKRVEVIAFEIEPEKRKKTAKQDFLDDIEIVPDFPSIDQIRNEGWPEKW